MLKQTEWDSIAMENVATMNRLHTCSNIMKLQYPSVIVGIRETKRLIRGREFVSEFKIFFSLSFGGDRLRQTFTLVPINGRRDMLAFMKHCFLKLLYTDSRRRVNAR